MLQQQLEFAAGSLASGNLAASEIVCRNILDVDPKNVAALNLLGIVAANVGATDHAKSYLKAALRIEPGNQRVRANLDLLKTAPIPQNVRRSGGRYLLIKSWGYGFWSDVSQILGSLLLAEITHRTPVTHWGRNSLFGNGSADDAFKLYFEPVSTVSLNDLANIGEATFFPEKWTSENLASEDLAKWHGKGSRAAALYFLNRGETIAVSDFYTGVIDVLPWIPSRHPMHRKPLHDVYHYLIGKYLVPTSAMRLSCDAFFDKHLHGNPFVAVHLRGSDKILEDKNLHSSNEACLSALSAVDPDWRIFLLTDDERLWQRMTSIYGSRIITTESQRTNSSTGVHYLPSINRVQAGSEIMTDTYLALRAKRFIGSGRSNVSAMIDMLKRWKGGESTLIGRSQLTERNLYIHLRQ